MGLQVSVNHTAPVVPLPILLVLLGEALLLPGRHPCWDSCFSSCIGQANKGVAGDTSVLLGWKDEPEVAVLPSAEVALNRRHIRHQELVAPFDGGVVGLACMLG